MDVAISKEFKVQIKVPPRSVVVNGGDNFISLKADTLEEIQNFLQQALNSITRTGSE